MIRLLLLLMLVPFFCGAQKGKDTFPVFLDGNLKITQEKNVVFKGIAIKEENAWMVYALYPDTTPVVKAYFKDRKLTIKDGPFTLYYPKNIKASEGHFRNNKMNGVWQFWYGNGQLKDSGLILDDFLVGQWKSWYENGNPLNTATYKESLTSTEQEIIMLDNLITPPPLPGIRSGLYTSWYSNGNKESEGRFVNNLMEGDWQWYHLNGTQSTVETYANRIVTALQCFDTAGRATEDFCSISSPAILKQYGNYKDFIFENLSWTDEAKKKKIQGDVVVRFRVNREGKLQNLTFEKGHPLLQKIVEDFFQQHMQDWYPAISHNRVVVWEDELVIPFRLNSAGNFYNRSADNDW